MKSHSATAIYCRTAQPNRRGIETQESMLRQYAADNNHKNVVVYADNGYSGINLDRPALCRLQADINAGLVGLVIVKDFSRISRGYIQGSQFLNELKNKNIEVKTLADGYGFEEHSIIKAITKFYSETRKRKKSIG